MGLRPGDILYEDNHYIVVNKKTGELVQGDRTGDLTLADEVKEYIKRKYKKPGDVFLGVIHRLDRPVSGAVIYARTSKGLERMNELFRERKIEKTYRAIVSKRPPQTEDRLEHYIRKNEKINRATASAKKPSRGGQKAVLTYKLIGRIGEHYLLEVKPETGRPHQIRVQLAKIGCPISGDKKYGSDKPHRDGGIYLHSYSLEFDHPVKKKPVRITAAVPEDQVWQLFKNV